MDTNRIAPISSHSTASEDSSVRWQLIEQCRALSSKLAANVAHAERERRVALDNIAALADAQLLRLAVPRRYGGLETNLRTMVDVSSCLAESCGSTAWVVANLNLCSWLASLLTTRGQDEIFGVNPDARIAGAFAPSTQIRRVDGGAVVSGRWYYCSGAAFADWGLVGLLELAEDGEVVDQYFSFIPVRELAVEETWFTVGMRGTASNCFVAKEVFIPSHRMLSVLQALKGNYPSEHKSEVLYRSPFSAFLPLSLTGPLLGLGRAALRYVLDAAPRRAIASTIFKQQSESTAFQLQVSEAAMKLDTAELHVHRAVAQVDEAAVCSQQLDLKMRARIRADAAYAANHVTDAINTLVTAHGAGSFAESNPLQQIWRDANIAANHAALLPAVGLEVYGKALLGFERNITVMV